MTTRRQKRLIRGNLRLSDADRAVLDACSAALNVGHSEVLRRGLHALAETLTPIPDGKQTETTYDERPD